MTYVRLSLSPLCAGGGGEGGSANASGKTSKFDEFISPAEVALVCF